MRGCFYVVFMRQYKNIKGVSMKFRCKLTGCIYEFFYEHDIISMLEHPQYEKFEEISEPTKVEPKKSKKEQE